MNETTHIIDKVFLEVNTTSDKKAYVIKDNISSFLESELLPKLEMLLDKYDVQNSVVRINELHLDVALEKWENQEQLNAEITGLIDKKLQSVVDTGKRNGSAVLNTNAEGKLISPGEKMQTVFLYFLENGRLPWFGKHEHIQEISRDEKWQENLKDSQFVEKLNKILVEGKFAVRRFVLQFSEKMVFDFVKSKNREFSNSDVSTIQKLSDYFSATNQNVFLQFLVETVVEPSEQNTENRLQKLKQLISKKKTSSATWKREFKTGVIPVLKKIHPDFLTEQDWKAIFESGFDKSIPEKPKDEIDNPIDDLKEVDENVLENDEELFVENAGLILLHPFFKSFFNEFEFLDETDQLLNNRKEVAVQALHYLATGSEEFFEGNLLFEKFLCNVPQKWPISRDSQLNDQIRNEVESLLNATIKNWPALKNTSPDGLRQMFLQRDGKLLQTESGFKLIVERKAQDILLNKLSWNISVIKIPWRESVLFVEW